MPAEPLTLPHTSSDWNPFIADGADSALDAARDVVALLTDGTSRTPLAVLELWNDADARVATASGFTSLFAEVHPDASVRELAEVKTQEITAFLTERGQNRELYNVFAVLDASELDAEAARLLNHVLRDFTRSGVDRDDATRARLTEISERSTIVAQEFSRNIRDDVRTLRLRPEQLDGLPDDYRDEHGVGDDGLVAITTDYPDTVPFLTFATDREARHAVSRQFNNRAWPANDQLLHELLDLRAEQATLLGYDSWPDFDTEVKMIGSGDAIGEFIERISDLAGESGRAEVQTLLKRAQQDDPTITAITVGDGAYYTELVRREQFGVDAGAVRRFFDFDRVRAGLLEVTGRLFGISYRERPDVPRWSDDVTCYDVLRGDERIGRIYLDLHPREGKYKHAAQFDLATGVSGMQLPEGTLVCNFPRGLMEHSQVVTLFHEFGHLVHHVLGGNQRWVRFSGVATEWDFVEAPSQMLEEWAWDADILRSFAVDADGVPIPADLVARMRTAEDFGRAQRVRTQMHYAAVSYRLHRERPVDHDAAVAELARRYSLITPLSDTHFQAAFGHLEGYGSGYYTYMWSLVIAKDLFSAFDPQNLFDAEVAARYRDEILARGGSADAADLVAAFLGRPYSFDAFGRWLEGDN
ncbi:M3 family metallopeptidase [Paramicrobacterium chengjingii]|uniref:Zn-dependent oligopeptidase n=1 Tax=Paramicrobacterium chengjingii TaxID=2769067 RepID=A0ABX6YKT5_9MICO|nr:M3 family metallopeptidase [Microbacterium chengjingii]QPZ39381.1 Zn-dependent oligopeptidase [Microbacterium chengjingii]